LHCSMHLGLYKPPLMLHRSMASTIGGTPSAHPAPVRGRLQYKRGASM